MLLLFPSVAVWRAASAMTAMKPTLAASPACPTVLHLCPGVTVSPVLVCRPVTPLHPPAAVTWARSPRLSSRLTRCPRAAPDASPAPSAATSWKVWTLETVIWSVAIWATPTCLAKACTTTTTMIIWPTGECLYVWVQRQVFQVCRRVTGLVFDDVVTSFMSSVVLVSVSRSLENVIMREAHCSVAHIAGMLRWWNPGQFSRVRMTLYLWSSCGGILESAAWQWGDQTRPSLYTTERKRDF